MLKRFANWLYSRTHKKETATRNHYPEPISWGSNLVMPGNVMGSYKCPEMPKSMEDVPTKDLQDAMAAINNSRAMFSANSLNSLVKENVPLKDWEVKRVAEAYADFSAKYKSPLSDAMK